MSKKVSKNEHQSFTVVKRIVDKEKLVGVIAEKNDKSLIRFATRDIIAKILNNYDFNIRVESNPISKLTVVEENQPDSSCKFYFKTVADRSKKNNFNSLPEVKYNSTIRTIRIFKD